jgi:hypothetical protein
MKRLMALALSAAVAAGTLAATSDYASARDWHHWHHHHGWGTGAAIGAGILGGAIIGGALAGPSYYGSYYGCDPMYGCGGYYPSYYRPYYGPRVIYRARPVYRSSIRLSRAHVQWCYDRYRSYRSYDNTFQPYNGPRQQCYSPYD